MKCQWLKYVLLSIHLSIFNVFVVLCWHNNILLKIILNILKLINLVVQALNQSWQKLFLFNNKKQLKVEIQRARRQALCSNPEGLGQCAWLWVGFLK